MLKVVFINKITVAAVCAATFAAADDMESRNVFKSPAENIGEKETSNLSIC
jgi:hypothetical protein